MKFSFAACSSRITFVWFVAFFNAAKKSNMFTLSTGFVPQCRDPDLGGQHFMLPAVVAESSDHVSDCNKINANRSL